MSRNSTSDLCGHGFSQIRSGNQSDAKARSPQLNFAVDRLHSPIHEKTTIIAAILTCARSTFGIEHKIPVELTPTPAPDKSQYNLVSPTPIDLRRPYNTDRPSKTDSAYTIDAALEISKRSRIEQR
jgi:hypothetical protein